MFPLFHDQFDERVDLFLQRSFFVSLALYVWALPIGRTIALRNILMVLLVMNGIWQLIRKRKEFKFPLRMPWFIYGVFVFLSLFTAVDFWYSLNEMKLEYFYPLILFLLVVNYCRTEDYFYRFVWVIVIGNVFLVGYSLYITIIGGPAKDGLVGSLNSGIGTYSTYLITIIPLVALLAWQKLVEGKIYKIIFLVLLLCAALTSLYLTLNRQSFLVLIADFFIISFCVLWYKFSWKKAIIMFFLSTIFIVGLFLISNARVEVQDRVQAQENDVNPITQSLKNDIRWAMWKVSLAVVADSPWQGRGFGIHAFESLKNKQIPEHLFVEHAHNLLINKAIQLGIPGVLAFLMLYFSPLVFLCVNLKRGDARPVACAAIAVLAGVFLKNMTDDFFNRDLAYLYWIVIGASFACLQNIDQKSDEKISCHPSR